MIMGYNLFYIDYFIFIFHLFNLDKIIKNGNLGFSYENNIS